ncbi:GNAT family N-acetyltransferase [Enterobacter cloacae]|nr:GNAT family N-acetyltransferase [Enterobacter cloacae]
MIVTLTPRLILRSFEEKDAAELFDYLYSPRTPCYQNEKLDSLAEATADVKKRRLDPGCFAVCLKDTDKLIGHLFAKNVDEPDPNTLFVGWHFNERFEGCGYAKESVSALFQYLFYEKQVRRLYAYVEDYNLASRRLCERLGMRQEGCFKEFVSFTEEDGEKKYDNTFVYAILKKEWILK